MGNVERPSSCERCFTTGASGIAGWGPSGAEDPRAAPLLQDARIDLGHEALVYALVLLSKEPLKAFKSKLLSHCVSVVSLLVTSLVIFLAGTLMWKKV